MSEDKSKSKWRDAAGVQPEPAKSVQPVAPEPEEPKRMGSAREQLAPPPFDIPPEWRPDAPNLNLTQDILRVKDGAFYEPPGFEGELEKHWCSKDPAYVDTALDAGLRPAVRNPNGPQVFARPNIDPQSPNGTLIEKHDSVLMVGPRHIFEKIQKQSQDENVQKRRALPSTLRDGINGVAGDEASAIVEKFDQRAMEPVFPRTRR